MTKGSRRQEQTRDQQCDIAIKEKCQLSVRVKAVVRDYHMRMHSGTSTSHLKALVLLKRNSKIDVSIKARAFIFT